jgi:hypothetical protein
LQQQLEDWRRREEEQTLTAKRFQRDEVLSGAFICRWLANRGCLLFLRRGVKLLLLPLDANKTDALHELN